MNQVLDIKNMVCNRCFSMVFYEFNILEFDVKAIELGQVDFVQIDDSSRLAKLEIAL